jgi:hypothetical protein
VLVRNILATPEETSFAVAAVAETEAIEPIFVVDTPELRHYQPGAMAELPAPMAVAPVAEAATEAAADTVAGREIKWWHPVAGAALFSLGALQMLSPRRRAARTMENNGKK